MGSEFLKKTRKTHVKSLDKGRSRLGTPTLFTRTPQRQPRCAIAKIAANSNLHCGEKVIVQLKGNDLVAVKGNKFVAEFKNPPADIVAALKSGHGVAKGEVRRINSVSKTADISIC